jgi:uncharacterized protein YqeY
MSAVLQRLDADIKDAMKARAQVRLDTLRMVKTTVKNKEIDLIRPVTEPEFITLLSTMVKQRKESIDQFTKGGRVDLADKEQGEIDIINGYLPQPLTQDELKSLVASAVKVSGATGPQDMGKVMKELKEPTSGRVDGKVLADAVKAALQA